MMMELTSNSSIIIETNVSCYQHGQAEQFIENDCLPNIDSYKGNQACVI
jgi:hypothetical protein